MYSYLLQLVVFYYWLYDSVVWFLVNSLNTFGPLLINMAQPACSIRLQYCWWLFCWSIYQYFIWADCDVLPFPPLFLSLSICKYKSTMYESVTYSLNCISFYFGCDVNVIFALRYSHSWLTDSTSWYHGRTK